MLPAKLTPMEEYFYLVDQPRYPMEVLIRMQLIGEIDRNLFELSIATIVARHPLLRATVNADRGLRWQDNPDWQPTVQWDCTLLESGYPQVSHLNINEEPGLRIWASEEQRKTTVFLQVHHCCADGLGLVKLTEELLSAYEQLVSNGNGHVDWKLPVVEARHFRRRASPETPAWKYPLRFWRYPSRFRDYRRMYYQHPVAIKQRCQNVEPLEQATPTFLTHHFDADQSAALRQRSRDQGVTINSLLLQRLLLAIEDWRNINRISNKTDLLRVCLPVNLRTADVANMTIANSISFLLVDHRPAGESPAAVLEKVHRHVHDSDRDLRLSFNVLVRVGRRLPGGIQKYLGAQECWATCLFSNLGRVLEGWPRCNEQGFAKAGNLTLNDWELLPPLQKNMGLTISCSSYAGRLKLLFYYDRNCLSKCETTEIRDLFIDRVLRTSDVIP